MIELKKWILKVQKPKLCWQILNFERWFNLTVVNISEEDADDYTCVGVNAGGVSKTDFVWYSAMDLIVRPGMGSC